MELKLHLMSEAMKRGMVLIVPFMELKQLDASGIWAKLLS